LFIYIVYRFDLNLKLRGMFFRDFLVNEKLKYFAYFFSLLLSILVIISRFSEGLSLFSV